MFTRPNQPQPSLSALNPRATASFSVRRSSVRLVEQERAVGLDPIAVAAAQQAADRLSGRLAEDVPQRDVDAADRHA